MTDGPDLPVLDELEARLSGALYPDRRPRRVTRRRWLAPLGGIATAVAAAVLVIVLVSSGSVETPIAAALDRAARAVEQRPAAPAVGPGQFWYTRISATSRFPLPLPAPPGSQRQPGIPPTVWLVQRSTTETWVGLDGTVRTRNVPIGARRFATLADHARYLAWGGPLPRSPTGADSTVQGDDGFPPGLALFRYRELVRLRPSRARSTSASIARWRSRRPARSASSSRRSRTPRPSRAARSGPSASGTRREPPSSMRSRGCSSHRFPRACERRSTAPRR